jgi:hypothetical protein
LSNDVRCSCVVPECPHYGKEEYTQPSFIRRHLRKHGFEKLKQIALENGIISSVNSFVGFDWLVDEIAKLCRKTGTV